MPPTPVKLLQAILRAGSCSRADLAKMMKVSRPAVSSLVDGFLRKGILRESGCGVSSGGKPPIMLELEPARVNAIGIDIGHQSLLRGVLSDAAGQTLLRLEENHDHTFESILAGSAALVERLRQASPAPVAGVAAAIAGQIDTASDEIVHCANFPLAQRRFGSLLARKVNLPVGLDNRARTAALWEYYFGAGRTTENFIFISAERGIGTAIYLNGRVFRGRFGAAGEIRRLCVPSPDLTAQLTVEEALDESFLQNLAETAGEPAAMRYTLDVTAYLITVLTMLMDPDRIVLGGRFRERGDSFAAALETRIVAEAERPLHITLSQSGRIGAAQGAALKVILNQFRNIVSQS